MESKISPYDVWVLANTIRIHFKGKSPVTGMLYNKFPVTKFETASERFVCKRLSDRYMNKRNITLYVAANLVYDPNIWFHSLEGDDCKRRYFEARRNLDSPLRSVELLMKATDINSIEVGDPIPSFISGLMCGKFTPEQICILDIVTPFINRVATENTNLVVQSLTDRLIKYKFFCSIKDVQTRDQIKSIVQHSKGV